MPLLPASFFQPPTPSILLLVPPSSPIQWLIRFSIFLLALASLPFLAILTPLSILCLTSPIAAIRQLAPLPIHPDNLPPKRTRRDSILRGVIAYFLGGCIWSITGIGTAPEFSHSGARRLAHIVAWLVNYFGGYGRSASRLEVTEETIPPFPDELNVGIFANKDLHKPRIEALWLHHVLVDSPSTRIPSSSGSPPSQRRVFLFFGGGGYVTGWPLVHPFVFSLTRSFPPLSRQDLPIGDLPAFAVFAPNVRKSLSRERAFPVPVLDGLAAYTHLRCKGYRPEEITLMGDSAGGGLAWSVAAYLAILQESQTRRQGAKAGADLGVPGALVLISVGPTPSDTLVVSWLCFDGIDDANVKTTSAVACSPTDPSDWLSRPNQRAAAVERRALLPRPIPAAQAPSGPLLLGPIGLARRAISLGDSPVSYRPDAFLPVAEVDKRPAPHHGAEPERACTPASPTQTCPSRPAVLAGRIDFRAAIIPPSIRLPIYRHRLAIRDAGA